ncbi:MAG: 1-acyl-sn-glycerol-3-phosphate acyltransferase [Oscillospiraceae bacterium]|nr:1-acyl-sn-glycerol-3-phosphate acyltransferase [Oscillospiraceae bacterium]
MNYQRPSLPYYRLAQAVSKVVATCVFQTKILRNEIRDAKGPFIVIANHQAAYDFVSLIGACKRPMSFVISNSFYQSLPIQGILDKMAVIPKQQFQTTANDLKKIRSVTLAGEPVVIYPAGLMCEDGISTPIPAATYKLLKWLGVDVYMAKISGTYFAMPKWTSGFRPGKTTLDIYKLFDKDELKTLDQEAIRARTKQALDFDAYREQERLLVKYINGSNVQGLENVLYVCPHCGAEFSITAQDEHALRCESCGYTQESDEFGFLHKISDQGEEIRYVSDWSRWIYSGLKNRIARGKDTVLSAKTAIHMVDPKKKKYIPVGEGTVTLNPEQFLIEGTINGEAVSLTIPTGGFPTLPFSPGKHIEIQDGKTIYRCVLEDGRLAMKFINMVKIFFELKNK